MLKDNTVHVRSLDIILPSFLFSNSTAIKSRKSRYVLAIVRLINISVKLYIPIHRSVSRNSSIAAAIKIVEYILRKVFKPRHHVASYG